MDVLEEQDRAVEVQLPGVASVSRRSQRQPPTSGAVALPLPIAPMYGSSGRAGTSPSGSGLGHGARKRSFDQSPRFGLPIPVKPGP